MIDDFNPTDVPSDDPMTRPPPGAPTPSRPIGSVHTPPVEMVDDFSYGAGTTAASGGGYNPAAFEGNTQQGLPQMPPGTVAGAYGTTPGNAVYAADAEDSSRATSPPSSTAPFEDDEFTHSLLQRAAKNLGVDYTPASHSGIRSLSPSKAVAGAYGTGTPGKHVNVIEPVLDSHSISDVQHMIDVRTKALGPNHPSVASLHLQMGDKILGLGPDRAPRAENHYNAALAAHEAHFGYEAVELVPCMTKLGNFYMSVGKYSQAKEMFRRSMLVADRKCGGGEALEGAEGTAGRTSAVNDPVKKAMETQQRNHLHSVLKDLAGKRGNPNDIGGVTNSIEGKSAVSGQLLSAWSKSIKDANTQLEKEQQRKTIEIQTEKDETDALLEPLPPPSCLTQEQLERVRAPTLRSAKELRDLVGYIKEGGHTPAPLSSSVRVGGAATPGGVSATMNTSNSVNGAFSPRSEAAGRRAAELQRTIEALRAGPQLSRSSLNDSAAPPGHYSPQDATEREVARLLMSAGGFE